MTWIFGTTNRMQAINPGHSIFILVLLHSLFVPLQGKPPPTYQPVAHSCGLLPVAACFDGA